VTVCIAGINHSNPQPYIITASDRKISIFGGWISAEGVAVKIHGINKDWTVMFSGPVSSMNALVDAIRERTARLRGSDLRPFARLCREVYMDERKPLIESEVLGDYDVDSYSDYVALRKSDPEFHAKLTEKIREMEQDWNLLFAGFDRNRHAHIFTITECGRIGFYDTIGYAAIGSGALRASVALASYPFRRQAPFSEAIFGIAAAKFAAEAADGVGEETILSVLEPKTQRSPIFMDQAINDLRTMWNDLPRFPEKEAMRVIWNQLTQFQQVGWLKSNRQLKPSIAEKVASEL
jgi:20S proteasome alpha/beta subunit